MRPILKTGLVVSMMALPSVAMAQMSKCTDAAGKTTYANRPCKELGLKDAGEVRDLIQVTPAPATPASQPPFRPSQASRSDSPEKPAAAVEDAAAKQPPDRRCFTTSVKGKTVTRCNDKPDEPAN